MRSADRRVNARLYAWLSLSLLARPITHCQGQGGNRPRGFADDEFQNSMLGGWCIVIGRSKVRYILRAYVCFISVIVAVAGNVHLFFQHIIYG